MRGSIRSVIVTDSAESVALATDNSIKRKSGRLTDQNAASASSRSKSGTSSQLEMAFMSRYRPITPRRPFGFNRPSAAACQNLVAPIPVQLDLAVVTWLAAHYPPILLRQHLVQLPLIEVLFFRIERSRINHPYLFPVGPIHAKHSDPAHRPAQVEEPRLDRKPG